MVSSIIMTGQIMFLTHFRQMYESINNGIKANEYMHSYIKQLAYNLIMNQREYSQSC